MKLKSSDFRTDFENGNGRLVELEPRLVRFEAEARRSPRPLWFHFELARVPTRALRLELANAASCLGGLRSFEPARPVYSYDGTRWRRFRRTGIDQAAGSFWFEGTLARAPVRIAFSHPYTYSDLRTWLTTLGERRGLAIGSVRRTRHGREVPLLRLTPPDGAEARFGVWLVARQHAGEAPGSFSLEGLVGFLLGQLPEAKWLRRNVAFNLAPMVDVDSVYEGAYGKDAAPADFNRDWTDRPRRPTIRALRTMIGRWARDHPYDVSLDFHAPTAGEPNYAFVLARSLTDRAFRIRQERFTTLLEKLAPRDCPFSRELCRCLNEQHPIMDTFGTYQRVHHGVFAICLEHSYHRTGSGDYVTPERLRRFGRAVGKTLAGYFQAEKS